MGALFVELAGSKKREVAGYVVACRIYNDMWIILGSKCVIWEYAIFNIEYPIKPDTQKKNRHRSMNIPFSSLQMQ